MIKAHDTINQNLNTQKTSQESWKKLAVVQRVVFMLYKPV